MKIIVIGIGKVGYTVAEQLIMENHDVTLIDTSRDVLRDALGSLDAIGIHGNGATSAILLEAGVSASGLVIALTGSDELNLLCCLVAKKLGAEIKVTGFTRLAKGEGIEKKVDDFAAEVASMI